MIKAKSKKIKPILIFVAIILSVSIVLGALIYHNAFYTEKPFENIVYENIKSVSIYSNYGEFLLYTFEGESYSRLMEILRELEIKGQGSKDYKNYIDEKFKMFRVEMTDGNVTDITATSQCAILNGKAYKADSELLNELHDYYLSCLTYMKPFWNLRTEDIKSISLYSINGDILYTLNSDEQTRIVEMLTGIEFCDLDYREYNGGFYPQWRLEKIDGTVLNFSTDLYFEANGQKYEVPENNPSLNGLNAFHNEYYNKYFVALNVED